MTDRYFPLFIPTEGKKILIFGGGGIALRRIKTLLNYGFELYAVSRGFCDGIEALEKENRIKMHRAELALSPAEDAIISLKGDIGKKQTAGNSAESCALKNIEELSDIFGFNIAKDTYFALSCLDNREINKGIGEYFKSKNIPVNVCDSREECDFFFPAIAVSDSISVGVTGTGFNHNEVRRAAARIREIAEKKDY